MGALRLHAIAVDEVREILGAGPELAARLRELARNHFAPPPPPATGGVRGRLGPLFRRAPQALVLAADEPTPEDLELLLRGGYVPPERAAASWRLLDGLATALAWDSLTLPLDHAERDGCDFDLARAGVSSELGLGRLLDHDAGLGLLPPPGRHAAYRPGGFALTMATAWRAAVASRAESITGSRFADQIQTLTDWLGGFAAWTEQASAQGRQPPDLVALADR